jgi:hypothetical protein
MDRIASRRHTWHNCISFEDARQRNRTEARCIRGSGYGSNHNYFCLNTVENMFALKFAALQLQPPVREQVLL